MLFTLLVTIFFSCIVCDVHTVLAVPGPPLTDSPVSVSPPTQPTQFPTSLSPTKTPTSPPTSLAPTSLSPTNAPTTQPTSLSPTSSPTSLAPTSLSPTNTPTSVPTSLSPTNSPTSLAPTSFPTSLAPTTQPTQSPTSLSPTKTPTSPPTSLAPTSLSPTNAPTTQPTNTPTSSPTSLVPTSLSPTNTPTAVPTSLSPTSTPTSLSPTNTPTAEPTVVTESPTSSPTTEPSKECIVCTLTQGAYGAKCTMSSPACIIKNKTQGACIRDACLSGPIVIGNASLTGGKQVIFNSALAIQKYLPASGAPNVLKATQINPLSTSAGILGGQLLTATLNQLFAPNTELYFSTTCSSLSPLILGRSVVEVIYIANQVISGSRSTLYSSFKPSILNEALSLYNNAFEGCQDALPNACFDCGLATINESNDEKEVVIEERFIAPSIYAFIIVVSLILLMLGIFYHVRRNLKPKFARV